jgi:hypothetical protein
MPQSESTFTDWQQEDNERRLLMDEDFSWSDPPARARRNRDREPMRNRSRTVVLERERDEPIEPAYRADEYRSAQYRPEGYRVEDDAAFEAARQQWSDAYSEALNQTEEADGSGTTFDLSDSGRRTVIITGRGDARYIPESRRRRGSELRFHERSGFNPDRAALWAVLLGVALLIGCIAH